MNTPADSYLIIESEPALYSGRHGTAFDMARGLVALGKNVAVFMVQNGVFAARCDARGTAVSDAVASGVTVLADDFSLRERGIGGDQLHAGITPSPLETFVDRLAAGAKVLWY